MRNFVGGPKDRRYERKVKHVGRIMRKQTQLLKGRYHYDNSDLLTPAVPFDNKSP